MSPKARPRGKAKARGRPDPLRRPAAANLRRPAAAEVEVVEDNIEERFKKGETVILSELPARGFQVGKRLTVTEGTYYGGKCRLAGRIREVKYGEGGGFVTLMMTGTDNEELLKHVTGAASNLIQCHLCPNECPGEPYTPAEVHGWKGRLVQALEEASLTWEKNLEKTEYDELRQLREAQADYRGAEPVPPERRGSKEKKKVRSSSSSSRKKKKKKKK